MMLAPAGLPTTNIRERVNTLSACADTFFFPLPLCWVTQWVPNLFPANAHGPTLGSQGSQLSTTAPYPIPLISAVIQPHRPSPSYLSTVHIDLALASILTCFSARGHHALPSPRPRLLHLNQLRGLLPPSLPCCHPSTATNVSLPWPITCTLLRPPKLSISSHSLGATSYILLRM